jgi:hypothetical protein
LLDTVYACEQGQEWQREGSEPSLRRTATDLCAADAVRSSWAAQRQRQSWTSLCVGSGGGARSPERGRSALSAAKPVAPQGVSTALECWTVSALEK